MINMVKCVLNGQYEIILPEHRALRPEWYTEKGWERERLGDIHDTLNENDIVFYIGAEEGDMCGLIAKWGGQLVMFEPNEKVWPNIKAIWEANKFNDPLASFVGFAANQTDLKNTKPILGAFPACADGEVIGDHGFKELAYEADVIPQIKIDDFVITQGIVPDMISLDVEGSEFEVLRGAEQTLRQYHPRIYLSLHPEFMFNMFGEYSMDLRRWIMDLGYKEVLLAYEHEAHFAYE